MTPDPNSAGRLVRLIQNMDVLLSCIVVVLPLMLFFKVMGDR